MKDAMARVMANDVRNSRFIATGFQAIPDQLRTRDNAMIA
jgi:hypothetical protein